MYLSSLKLTNFKNYGEAKLEFSPRINCFVGDNGVGKTNILDAIHYLSLTKSYFNTIDSINVRHNEDYFIIEGSFTDGNEEEDVYCAFQKDRKKVFKRSGKDYSRLSDHIGRYPVVMISPADSSIISDGSEERRRFMNNVISQYNHDYLDNVIRYNKALKNRNRLLKDYAASGGFDREMLRLWEDQMMGPSTSIYGKRSEFIKEIIPLFQEYYDLISDKRELVEMSYKSQLDDAGFDELIEKNLERDRILKYTTAGVHRDDINLVMNDHSIRQIGSQGQQKSYLVALKLAKFEYISKMGGKKPVLLMDDVFDKFDSARVEQIIKLVSENRFGQIFITDTHEEIMKSVLERINIEYRLFRIEDGIKELVNNGK
jgi:DNA replication and repair protein RecF